VALREAAYALDELGADDVLMMVNDGARHLGDQAFEPLFAELNRRRAVVFTHPAGLPADDNPVRGLDDAIAEYMLDTSRAVLNLIASGTLDRHPHVSIIQSHAGGFLPPTSAAGRRRPPRPSAGP
jgi:predicted TIM-barrel fold metal-dependent hydrolase